MGLGADAAPKSVRGQELPWDMFTSLKRFMDTAGGSGSGSGSDCAEPAYDACTHTASGDKDGPHPSRGAPHAPPELD